MPQKKKAAKKAAKKTAKKTQTKQTKQINQTIIQQTLPNYSSGQMSGHQYNKDHIQFVPQVQQTHTDNVMGDLVNRLMNKIENDNNKETQQYTKEIQPINNNNNQTVNIYSDTKKTDVESDNKKDEDSSVVNKGRSAAEDIGIGIAGGVGAIGVAAGATSAIRNKAKIGKGIKSVFRGAGTRLGGIAESSRLLFKPRGYSQQIDDVAPGVIQEGERITTSRASSVASSRRPSNASVKDAVQPVNITTPKSSEKDILEHLSDSIGFSSNKAPARSRANSNASSDLYAEQARHLLYGSPEQFSNVTSTANTTRKSGLDTGKKQSLDKFLKEQRLDTESRSPFNSEKFQGRKSEPLISFTGSPASQVIAKGRKSDTHLSDGINTRSNPPISHMEIQRPVPRSRTAEYRRAYNQRRRDERANNVRPMTEVLNPNSVHNQGYYGSGLTGNFTDGYNTRQRQRPIRQRDQAVVISNPPPRPSDLSQAPTTTPRPSVTRNIKKKK